MSRFHFHCADIKSGTYRSEWLNGDGPGKGTRGHADAARHPNAEREEEGGFQSGTPPRSLVFLTYLMSASKRALLIAKATYFGISDFGRT
jgi:hypothetical protein